MKALCMEGAMCFRPAYDGSADGSTMSLWDGKAHDFIVHVKLKSHLSSIHTQSLSCFM